MKKLLNFNLEELSEDKSEGIKKIENITSKDIAIVGMSGRFGMADNIDEFWSNLRNGVDCITELPNIRKKDTDKYLEFLKVEKKKARYSHYSFLSEIDKFDNNFFQISPREASLMDPNQRLFLQTAWEAIEDAGYGGKLLSGSKTGVFLGFSGESAYKKIISEIDPTSLNVSIPGNLETMIASRLSYILDLKGPSMLISTACSSALVAVYVACREIREGNIETAIAGSINLWMLPLENDQKLGIESADGRTRSFDDSSDGTGGGEGVAAIVLKPLSRALKDGDNIYAVIKGCAINQDGSSTGLTAPNPAAQEDVIVSAWDDAGIDPETISYIEAHGTGTALGDPIEIEGISRAFRRYTSKKQFCAVGSVKSNIGHLNHAAGISALIKVALALKHKEIPPSINFEIPNREINFKSSPLYVNDELCEWEVDDILRRCGVSSFGISGTNCHIVLEEAPREESEEGTGKENSVEIFVVSAKSEVSLKELVERYNSFLERYQEASFADLCYSSQMGRGHYNFRLAIVAKDFQDFKEKFSLVNGIWGGREKQLRTEGIYYGRFEVLTRGKKMIKDYQITEDERKKLSKSSEISIGDFQWSISDYEKKSNEICMLYVKGAEIKWETLHKDSKRKKVRLPVYAFERKRCWLNIREVSNRQVTPLSGMVENIKEEYSPRKVIINGRKTRKFAEINKYKNNEWERIPKFEIIESTRNEGGNNIIGKYAHDYSSVFLDIVGQLESDSEYKNIVAKDVDFENIKEYTMLLLLKTFSDAEILHRIGEGNTINELKSRIGVLKKHEKFFEVLFDIMNREGYININQGFITIDKRVEYLNINEKVHFIDDLREKIISKNPNMINHINLLEHCIENYILVLTGKKQGTSVIFPDSSIELVEAIYNNDENTKYNSKLAAWLVKKTIESRITTVANVRKIRILEIGAGIGATTIHVLDVIKDYSQSIEYYYTDISATFIKYGQENFRENYEFLKYKKLDVENDAQPQGFELEYFDIVLAANVIHATKDVKETINKIKKLMKANGIFIMIEGTKAWDFSTLTFGLLDGWWAYEDANLRIENSPLLNRNTWENVFEEMGFSKTYVTGDDRDYQSIVIGESNGIVEFNTKNVTQSVLEEKKVENAEYSETEQLVAQIWGEVLGFDAIDIYDNYYELGGDSILAMRILNNINKEMGLRLEVTDLLKHLTIEEFSAFIVEKLLWKEKVEKIYSVIQSVEDKEYYPLSSAQKRMFILNGMEGIGTGYNIPSSTLVEGKLDRKQLEYVFKMLVERHEVFRTSFDVVNGIPVQKIHKDVDFNLSYIESDEDNVDEVLTELIRPFDLGKAPLFRVAIIKMAENKHILMYDMHHIISDGTSIGILIKEFIKLYNNQEVPKLRIQYKDFAVWQNNFLASDFIADQETYWMNKFSGDAINIPVLNMPIDYQRPLVQSFEGESISFCISKELSIKLGKMAVECGTTLYILLLAIYNILLFKYTNQKDIIVGTPIEGRPHADLENIIGIFANTIVMRNFPEGTKTFRDFLLEVRENAFEAYKNQDFQFEMLVEKLNVKRNISRNPLFDTMFILQKVESEYSEYGGVKFTPYRFNNKTTRFDVLLQCVEKDNMLNFNIEYCTKLFKVKTIERIIEHFIKLMGTVVENSNILLSDVEMLSDKEKDLLLVNFNKEEGNSYDF